MSEFIRQLFSSGGFMPHGHCYFWKPEIIWLHVVSDSLIALAYYSIPLTLVYFTRKRRDLPYPWMFLMFGGFIVACGTTHLMEIWSIWHSTYWLSGVVKAATGLLSVATAVLLVKLVPQALQLRGPAELARLNAELESRVRERTDELARANAALQAEIAERRRGEEAIRASLREKEVLLKEIHHRVKNNLQVVSSLLRLQARSLKNPETVAAFEESGGRVQSMALVHEMLYQSSSLSELDFAAYARSLVESLLRAFGTDPAAVRAHFAMEPVPLNINQVIPCALILHELVSNALKYAFPAGRGGEIRLALRADADGRVHLTVGDDGVGLPPAVDPDHADSLGLQLVGTLTRQLHGRLEITRTGGTQYDLAFPAEKPGPGAPA
jgi:two-component sensor histidine kinase